MNTQDFIKRLRRYLSGTANAQESQLIDRWYNSWPDDLDIAPLRQVNKQQLLLAGIQSKIAKKQKQTIIRKLYIQSAGRAAAVFLLISFCAFFWWKSRDNELKLKAHFTVIQTGEGIIREITLPDSSTVWLNASGKIRYRGSFNDTSRVIYLDEGEAFFQVRKNPAKPFLVYTPTLHTRVLGTSFNIKSYRALDMVRVAVATGRVQIGLKEKSYGIYTANQGLSYNKTTGLLQREDTQATSTGEWKDGKIQLYQAGFDELALAYNNLYRLKLKAGTEDIKKQKYTITLERTQSWKDALTLINAIHQTKTRRSANELTLYR